jgi:predicted  nucleic acid-binding Zn-ribbon protein
MIVLNLVIGVIMNSMDESNKEMAIQQEMERRKENPAAVRDGLHDLHNRMEELSSEIQIIKKMIEEQDSTSKNA